MNIEGGRPHGFPLSEEALHGLKQIRLREILAGRHTSVYSEWLLRGPRAPFNPTAVVGIFPTPAAGEPSYRDEMEVEVYHGIKQATEYVKEVQGLELPRRVKALEELHYRFLANHGKAILEQIIPELLQNLMPSAVIAFSRTDSNSSEAAYLISPTLVPPSAAFQRVISHIEEMEGKTRDTR